MRLAGVVAAVALLQGACYDADLLGARRALVREQSGRSGGTGGVGVAGASGVGGVGGAGDVTPKPAGASGAAGSSVPRCGDGHVGGDERCDTGIPAGVPGACPSACVAPSMPCAALQLVGEACQTRCEPVALGCQDGDGCCPASCDARDDDDCSASCGDGVVQADAGETCEPGTDAPCPHEPECDDGDACTADALSGSEANCNSSCTHVEITALSAGDGCCPDGANANTDADCPPRCGNDVLEGAEECDGADGCDERCAWTSTPEQRTCLADFPADECRRCECIQCTQLALACFDSGDATRDMHCVAMESCGRAMDCASTACYCGTSPTCAFPNGPCRSVIEAAAGSTSPLVVDEMAMNPDTAIHRANELATCSLERCSDVCP